MPPLSIVILAAGQGTRMRSALPKVLHPVAGRPMLGHVIDAARELTPAAIHIVYGHGGEQVRSAFDAEDLAWVEQAEQLGTGDAVRAAMPAIPDAHRVLVLCGDVPLITSGTLMCLLERAAANAGVLALRTPAAAGYGRILRDRQDQVVGIVEEKDATAEQRAIDEISTGIMVFPAKPLRRWLAALSSDNVQGEYYLPDVVGMARRDNVPVHAVTTGDSVEVQGVNNRIQLAAVERGYQHRAAESLMRDQGVTLIDPERFDLRGRLSAGKDCVIDVNAVIEGEVVLGDGVYIEPHCVLRDCHLADGVRIASHSVVEGARLDAGAHAGPFARLRAGTVLREAARVGNFVEIKQVELGPGSKANHLAYLGDADIGAGVNVGAGTITCNYDGANKHRTVIEDGAFIGSDTQLIAPVHVGRNATIGAGTSLRADAPADTLTLSEGRQITVPGWKRPAKHG